MKKGFWIGMTVVLVMATLTTGCGKKPETAAEFDIYAHELMGKRKYQEAAEALTQAIALDRSDATLYSSRATMYDLMEDYDSALDDLTTAIELGDIDGIKVSDYERRARIYERQGDYEAALADVEAALRLDAESQVKREWRQELRAKVGN